MPLPRRKVRTAPRVPITIVDVAPKSKPKPKVPVPKPVDAPPPGPISIPRLPTSVYAVPHVAGILPPRAIPMPIPVPMPVHPMHMPMPIAMPPPPMVPAYAMLPPPVRTLIGCATSGCKSTVPTAGRRCLACVRGSWTGRKEAVEKEREKEKEKEKEQSTPKAPRVTIKLKVTPKAAKPALEVSADKVDRKGKSKAVEEAPSETKPAKLEVPVDKVDKKGEDAPSEGNSKEDDDPAGIWASAGWDSELSDLTNSDGESKIEEVPRPSFKIRIPARTPSSSPTKSELASALPTPPASVGGTPEAPRLCTIARCRVPLPPHSLYRWKCCSACRKQYREYQRDRLSRLAASNITAAVSTEGTEGTPSTTSTPLQPSPSAPAPAPRPSRTPAEVEAMRAHAAQKEWQRKEKGRALELAGVATPSRRRATDIVETWNVAPTVQLQQKQKRVAGARVCEGRACEHIIPGAEEYSWSMCGGCRAREQRKAERALVKEGKSPAVSAVQDSKDDFPVAEEQKPGRCMYADCGMLMPPADAEVAATECVQCIRRKLQRRPPGRPPGSRNKPKSGPATQGDGKAAAHSPQPTAPEKPIEVPRKRKRVSPYPAYQCCDALLKDFGTRFHGFIEAQSYYFLMRGNGGASAQPPAQAMFDFSGEYSVVAMNLDVVARKAEIEVDVHNVKDAVARAGGLEFSPTSWVSILGKPGGVVTRFACVHLVSVFLPIRMPPGHPPYPAHTKSMQGELEIAVLPDDSHKYFPGEKTIVRFRLVG
ncbi:hypothetical protein B0H19DRAFT_495255 [Mycena capillaripes]|nr:hypothetical protein B0H19DRAFT_495255 [Mycena capillaripes]